MTRLTVVVAHPDDETFGCGSVLLHAAAAGVETSVCCATRGEAGRPAPGSGVATHRLGEVREAELRTAAGLLGVGHVELLGFTDSGMAGPAEPATLAGADLDVVVEQVRRFLDEVRPDVVVTLDAGDGHRDHARIRDATLAAADAMASGRPRVYLQCLPRSLMARWLAHLAQQDPGSEHLAADVPGTPDVDVTTVVDSTRHLAARRRAIAAHTSQVSPYAGMPEDLERDFLACERLRRVRPAWTGGPLETDLF